MGSSFQNLLPGICASKTEVCSCAEQEATCTTDQAGVRHIDSVGACGVSGYIVKKRTPKRLGFLTSASTQSYMTDTNQEALAFFLTARQPPS